MVVETAGGNRVRGEIEKLVNRGAGLGPQDFASALARSLRHAVHYDGVCLLTIDPATLLPTAEIAENALPVEAMSRLSEIELREADYNKFSFLACSRRWAASLSEATAGDLERSRRQRELRRPNGFEDELRAVLCDKTGTWGALTLLRESGRAHFTSAEVGFLSSLTGLLATGLRSALLLGEATGGGGSGGDGDDDGDGDGDGDATGLVVLAPDNTVEVSNRAADRWLDELATADKLQAPLPTAVSAVANRVWMAADGDSEDGEGDGDESRPGAGPGIAAARVRTTAGRWVMVRGSLLGDGPGARVAVLLEAARAPEMAPLIADAYGFTERERRVAELVARGFSTAEIAERLQLSAYTVQDHLKSIFDKSGTGSRGNLVARLFVDHYAPRLAQL